MRILIVKSSSMGDVVHALPVVHDIRQAMPNAHIEWLVESTFAAIPRMHPGVNRVHALAWRRWRRKLFDRETWKAMGEVRAQLRGVVPIHIVRLEGHSHSLRRLSDVFRRGRHAGHRSGCNL